MLIQIPRHETLADQKYTHLGRSSQAGSTPVNNAERLKYQNSLWEFWQKSWEILEPANELQSNWHQELIIEHLELVDAGVNKKLLINIAPRHLKSLLCSVAFPCWQWLRRPELRGLYLSYSSSLANDLSDLRRSLIQSDWYQSIAPEIKLSNSKNRVSEFANDSFGVMNARGLEGSVTGVGGTMIVCLPFEVPINTDQGLIMIGTIVSERLKVKVKTFNHHTNEIEYSDILRYEENQPREIVEIDLGDRILRCTEDHPVWVDGFGYKKAGKLKPGDVVVIDDRTMLKM